MIEEAEYVVRVTLTTTVQFSPIERPAPITQQDAIANALGSVDYGTKPTVWDILEGEGFAIETEAEKVAD